MTAVDDHSLVERIASGDQTAYAVLVHRYGGRMQAVAMAVVKDPARADDMVQEAFVKLWTRADRFDPSKARFTTWFHQIVVNTCRDDLRRSRPDQLAEDYDAPDPAAGADAVLEDRSVSEAVRATVQTLPERQRLAVTLTYFDDLSNRDVAEIMGLGVKAVESLLVRARKTLRSELAERQAELLDG